MNEFGYKEELAELQSVLRKVQELAANGKIPIYGICYAADTLKPSDSATYLLSKLMRLWPKYAEGVYAVPGTNGRCPAYSFSSAVDDGTLWDRSTEYGRLRWELLSFLIEVVDEKLAEDNT